MRRFARIEIREQAKDYGRAYNMQTVRPPT